MTTYKDAGVDISAAESAKKAMAKSINTGDKRVLNKHGAFASLVEGLFPGYKHPVLVLKTEEPGSKQTLAFAHGHVRSICKDTIHHLINDIAVMGALPLYIQDAVICGRLEKEVVTEIVAGFADAARAQGCVLTGGETSEQPGVLPVGAYILTASIVGVVEKDHIIDGSSISKGDVVLGIASNGLHTNGYTLVRKLLEEHPEMLKEKADGRAFLDAILEPHRCYLSSLRGLFGNPALKGLAHITGGGIAGNVNRILPKGLGAAIDLGSLTIPSVFTIIRKFGNVPDEDMLRTYNLGVGLVAVASKDSAKEIAAHFKKEGLACSSIGSIIAGNQDVTFAGQLRWN